VSRYTAERCRWRAEACPTTDEWPRIIAEHEEAARSSDPDQARIARGFALIARRRRDEEQWRAEAYERLARGEDIDPTANWEQPDERTHTVGDALGLRRSTRSST